MSSIRNSIFNFISFVSTSAIAGFVLLLSIATTTFSGTIMLMGIGGSGSSAVPPLDIAGLTLALSMSRQLVSTYGGAYYTATGSVINIWKNQAITGANNDLSAFGSPGPSVTTGGPNNIAAAGFDGVSAAFHSSPISGPLSAYITASTGWVIACVLPNTINANNPSPWENNGVFGTDTPFIGQPAMGVFFKNTGTPKSAYAANNNGASIDVATAAASISVGTPYVVEWIHNGGNVELWINGVIAATTPSSDTNGMTLAFGLANPNTGSSTFLDGLIFEVAAASVIPPTRAAIATNFMTQCGVPTCSNSLDFSQACNSQYMIAVGF